MNHPTTWQDLVALGMLLSFIGFVVWRRTR
jgi:hypothetical protein